MKNTSAADVQIFKLPELESLMEKMADCVKKYIYLIIGDSLKKTEAGKVIDDAVASSGKMIRAKLLLLCGILGPLWEKNKEKLCALAAILELTHLASLIHDDIVDEAPYRRGKPSVQSKYGKNAAVYAGDFIIAKIYHYQTENGFNTSAVELSKAIEQMCIGEIGQDTFRYNEKITEKEYLHNIKGKTCALFKTACRMGASEAGCSDELINKLEILGENIGFMLQLRDDLLDFTAEGKTLGKNTHRDFFSGIYTMPLIKALENKNAENGLLPIILENSNRKLSKKEIAEIEEKVVYFGGVEKTRLKIKALAKKNKDILNLIGNQNDAVKLIKKIVECLEV